MLGQSNAREITNHIANLSSSNLDTRRSAANRLINLARKNDSHRVAIREANSIPPLVKTSAQAILDLCRSVLEERKRIEEAKQAQEQVETERLERERREAIAEEQRRKQAEKALAEQKLQLEPEKLEVEHLALALKKQEIEKQRQQTASPVKSVAVSSEVTTHSALSVSNMVAVVPGLPLIPWSELVVGNTLGSGSFGIISQAMWQRTTPVAVKQLMGQQLSDQTLIEFQQEVVTHLQLRNPNIVSLYGICLETPYALVLEFMMQGSLRNVLEKDQALPWLQRLQIARDVASGLAFLHSRSILHRDLKSSNILMDEHGKAKLSDFGLSVVKESSKGTTKAGVAGSPLWMAPELFDDGNEEMQQCTKASDVYSLAIVLWEIATRRLPYEAKSIVAIMKYVLAGKREAIPAETPAGVGRLIRKCWAQQRADRPSSENIAMRLSTLYRKAQVVPYRDIIKCTHATK